MIALTPNRLRALGSPWLLAPLLTLGLYWRALWLPFFWDDVPNFFFATTRTFLQIWTDVRGFPYYRPALFTFWKVALALLPSAPTFLFHLISLAVHTASAILVGSLARRFSLAASPAGSANESSDERKIAELTGLIASLLFAVYPFAVLPVSHVASLFHLAVTLASLGAVAAALKFVEERKWRWLALTLFLAALAPYLHESGVMAGALAVWAVVVADRRAAWRNKWFLGLVFLASALFLPVWLVVPKTHDPAGPIGWESIWASFTVFVQCLTYPVQPLARPLVERGWWDLGAVWLAALPALLAAVLLLRHRRRRLLALALGWFALAIAPSVLALPYSYLFLSMRLFYFQAPGAVWLWAAVCMCLATRLRRPWGPAPAAIALSVLLAAPNAVFVYEEVSLHRLALEPVWQLAAIAREHPHERHFMINAEDWVADVRAWYPIGHEGVEVMPVYVTPGHLAEINSGVRAEFGYASFPQVLASMDHHYYGVNDAGRVLDWASFAAQAPTYDRVWVETYSDKRIAIEEVGAVQAGEPKAPATYLASFEGKLYLSRGEFLVAGQEAVVTLYWKYLGPDSGATIFRHVFDCAGNVLGLGDGHALGRMLLFGALAPGAEVRDVRHIPLQRSAADGCYYLEVGLFRPDGSRVTALAPDGSAFENAVVPIH